MLGTGAVRRLTATLSAMFAIALIVPAIGAGSGAVVAAEAAGAITFDTAAAPASDLAPVVADALAASPRSHFVTIDSEELLAQLAAGDVSFELFDDVTVQFGATGELTLGVSGDPTWSGTTPTATATLTFGADGVRGSIQSDATSYSFVPVDGSTHAIYEEGRTFPEAEEPLVPPAVTDGPSASADAAAPGQVAAGPADVAVAGDGTPVIRVLTVFDDAASTVLGGDAAAIAELSATIDEVNAAYARSGVNLRMEAAAIERIADGPPMSSSTALRTLTNPSDGRLDAVHTRRDALAADLVVLITYFNGTTCGQAWLLQPPFHPSDAAYGFGVLDANCARGNLTFAHETGHNIGADHGPTDGSLGYNNGFINKAAGYRTIMAYDDAFCCTRLPYFSSPSVIGAIGASTGQPLGSATQNNARVLNEQGPYVAAFRSGGSVPPPACAPVSSGSLVPLSPARLLDTRAPNLTVDGLYSGMGPRPAGSVTEVQVTGRGCVPADASAVVLNVTVVQAAAGGYASVFPCGGSVPNASNLNFAPGQTVPNAVVAKVGAAGKVCVFAEQPIGLLVDVNAYVPAGSSVGSLVPARLLDTRAGAGTIDGQLAGIGQRGAGTVTEVPVLNRGGVPGTAAAVVLNVTVVQAASGGYASVFPCGGSVPNASNLNFVPGQTVPNAVVSKVGTGGKVCVFAEVPFDLLIDVNGFVPAGSSLGSLVPARLLDTRAGGATVDGQLTEIGVRPAGSITEVPVLNRGGVPANATAVILNVTAVQAAADGYISVFPCGEAVPNASNVNYSAGQTVPNAVVAKIGAGGKVCVFAEVPTGLLVDVNGFVGP